MTGNTASASPQPMCELTDWTIVVIPALTT